ncbi:MAG TPA: archaemetzincin family Zn-dependent metalloprotease [Nitrososphaeraceae archaeon]|nr:archaemetzincin family Zn-dependent metalloprotease [Nitrososphaeraceae archaeon]
MHANEHIYDYILDESRGMEIIIQPVTANLDKGTLDDLAKDISEEFRANNVTVASSIELDKAEFQLAFNKQRKQWDSFKLLEWLLRKFKRKEQKDAKILGLFDIDAYSNAFDFVFGEAYYQGRIAAVYLPRLRQEFYSLEQNCKLFYERLVKEAIHELGHAYGIVHCKNPRCVMYFSISLRFVDTKKRSFCQSCTKKYRLEL